MKTIKTNYNSHFCSWLNNETEMQSLGLSESFSWQWFITMTSKDTMTKNGARLAIGRFLSLYLYESKTSDVECLWVAEPHQQGKKGYHIHALLRTRWPMPKQSERVHNLALLLDDVYQRAMGLSPLNYGTNPQYLDKRGRLTNKHRFRAEGYTKERGAYCAKYITKYLDDARLLWDYATLTSEELTRKSPDFLGESESNHERDAKGNWDKKWAKLRTKAIKRANQLRSGEKLIYLSQLNSRAQLNWAKFSKLRMTEKELELEYIFSPDKGVNVY